MVAGVGALATRDVLRHAEDAQRAGVAGVLLAPMSYQPLMHDDVLGLYRDVTAELSVPLVVYDNPGTTHFTFTDELYAQVAGLPRVASIKIPGVPADGAAAARRIQTLRKLLPAHVTVGVSGDAFAATGLNADCDAWYSVVGGTLPEPALRITRAARAGDAAAAAELSAQLQPLWDLFARHGSLRVVADIAEQLGLAGHPCLPMPILGLRDEDRARVRHVIEQLDLR